MKGFRPGRLPTLLVLLLLPLLLWLGVWQLERGEQKEALLAQRKALEQAEPLTPERLEASTPTYTRVHLQGSFDAEHSFLLDSRTRDGRVGVELIQPFYDEPSGRWVLLNRGWLPWPDRRVPVQFDTPQGTVKLAAWVYAPSKAPFVLARRMAEGWPKLTSHVEVEEIWQLLERDGVPRELRLMPGPAAYRVDWPTTTMSPAQHVGYAVQWFALAAALIALFIFLGRHYARAEHERDESNDRPD